MDWACASIHDGGGGPCAGGGEGEGREAREGVGGPERILPPSERGPSGGAAIDKGNGGHRTYKDRKGNTMLKREMSDSPIKKVNKGQKRKKEAY